MFFCSKKCICGARFGNDLDDIRIIMETQKKIRDQEIDMDMKIDLVEEAFALLSKYEIQCQTMEKLLGISCLQTQNISNNLS